MTIVIDGRGIGDRLSGIERYVIGLTRGLVRLDPPETIRLLVADVDRVAALVGDPGRVDLVPCPIVQRVGRPQLGLPGFIRRLGGRVLHAPYVCAPLGGRDLPVIITVHDLIPERCPQLLGRSWKVRLAPLWRRWCRAQYKRASAIVTVSEFSRSELIDLAGLDPADVYVAHNGVEVGSPASACAIETLRDRLEARGNIVSYIGRHDPYKNIDTLIRAFAAYATDAADPVTLVIAGVFDRRYTPALEAVAAATGQAERIRFTGYLTEDDRIALLGASSAFVFPSRYEGFGLPPLEAMAMGVPVVASTAGPIPEVLGSAAILIDPDDETGLADAIRTVIEDDDRAATLRADGVEQARRFTWEASAACHLEAYRTVMAGASPGRSDP